MVYKFDTFKYIIRLNKGESLVESLKQFVNANPVKSGWINGLGGALSVEIGFYDLENNKYNFKKFDDLSEVLSLQGNIAFKDGEPVFHLHGVFGDKSYQTFGGHVKDLIAGATLELYVHGSQLPITRKLDETVGLPLLDLGDEQAK